jgi:hypothetical protein
MIKKSMKTVVSRSINDKYGITNSESDDERIAKNFQMVSKLHSPKKKQIKTRYIIKSG